MSNLNGGNLMRKKTQTNQMTPKRLFEERAGQPRNPMRTDFSPPPMMPEPQGRQGVQSHTVKINCAPEINPPTFAPARNPWSENAEMPIPINLPSIPNNIKPSNMNTSISVQCPHETAQHLINTGSRDQLIANFELEEVTYNDGLFGLSGLNITKVVEAHQTLLEVILNYSKRLQDKPQWVWMTDDGFFAPYDLVITQIIESAYQKKLNNVNFVIGFIEYRIEFGNPHKQILMQKNTIRAVRRILRGKEDQINIIKPEDVGWFWQDDDMNFKPYTAEASRIIEHASRMGLSSALVPGHNGKGYIVDFNDMTQMNLKKRAIRRGNP